MIPLSQMPEDPKLFNDTCLSVMQIVEPRAEHDYMFSDEAFKTAADRIIEAEAKSSWIDLDYIRAVSKGDKQLALKMIGEILRGKNSMIDVEFENMKPVIE